jgi:hypothetical protein
VGSRGEVGDVRVSTPAIQTIWAYLASVRSATVRTRMFKVLMPIQRPDVISNGTAAWSEWLLS